MGEYTMAQLYSGIWTTLAILVVPVILAFVAGSWDERMGGTRRRGFRNVPRDFTDDEAAAA